MKNNNNIPDEIDALLSSIQSVDAPEFLLTRIHAKLENSIQDTISIKWAGLCSAALIALLVLNFWAIQQSQNKASGVAIVMEQMELISDNNFYNN